MDDSNFKFQNFQAVLSHEDIVDCAVVGVPDKLKGHTPLAIFIKKNGCIKGSMSYDSGEIWKYIQLACMCNGGNGAVVEFP